MEAAGRMARRLSHRGHQHREGPRPVSLDRGLTALMVPTINTRHRRREGRRRNRPSSASASPFLLKRMRKKITDHPGRTRCLCSLRPQQFLPAAVANHPRTSNISHRPRLGVRPSPITPQEVAEEDDGDDHPCSPQGPKPRSTSHSYHPPHPRRRHHSLWRSSPSPCLSRMRLGTFTSSGSPPSRSLPSPQQTRQSLCSLRLRQRHVARV